MKENLLRSLVKENHRLKHFRNLLAIHIFENIIRIHR